MSRFLKENLDFLALFPAQKNGSSEQHSEVAGS